MPLRTRLRLVRLVLTIRLTIALPEPRDTLLVISTAAMLSRCTVGNAGLHVPCQVVLVRTGALVAWGTLLDIAFHVEVG